MDVSAIFFIHVLNKYISPSLKYKVLIIGHSNVAWNLKISILYSPQSPYKITKNLKFISFPSGQDVLSSPQETRCSLSLVKKTHLVSARHPGNSFPVNLPPQSCPQPDQWQPSPLLALICPPFSVHKSRGLAGDIIS